MARGAVLVLAAVGRLERHTSERRFVGAQIAADDACRVILAPSVSAVKQRASSGRAGLFCRPS